MSIAEFVENAVDLDSGFPVNLADESAEASFVDKLRSETSACRLRRTAFGAKRKLSVSQTQKLAQTFNADAGFLRAQKKLVNTGRKEYRAVSGILTQAAQLWKNATIPYPDAGIRLIRRNAIESFSSKIATLKAQLLVNVQALQQHWSELLAEAKVSLGDLFRESDYPASISDLWSIDIEFPSIEPPDYLKKLNPELFEAECQRVKDRLNEAVHLAEEAFAGEFKKLLVHLADKLEDDGDGKKKVFRDTAVDNLKGFFERFRALNVGSNSELDLLVNQAQELVGGVTPGDLRKNVTLKDQIRDSLTVLATKLDGLVVAKPKRQIVLDDSDEVA